MIPDAYRELLITPDGGRPFVPVAPVDELVATMERYEIDAAVISTGPPGAFLGDQGRGQRNRARSQRGHRDDRARSAPERFAGLAILPLPDVGAAIDEVGYALDELRLDGVMLLSNTAGIYLGDERWSRSTKNSPAAARMHSCTHRCRRTHYRSATSTRCGSTNSRSTPPVRWPS